MSLQEEPTGGRLLVSLIDPPARAAWSRCVEALQAAGHLVTASDEPRLTIESVSGSSCELAILITTEGRSVERRVRDLLGWVTEWMPVLVAGGIKGPAARELIVAGAWSVVPAEQALPQVLHQAVARALRHSRALQREARFVPGDSLLRQLGAGEEMREVVRRVSSASGSQAAILVIGEPGSGKRIVARAVHSQAKGSRRQGPFVTCLLGGIDPAFVKEELYGTELRPGPYELAHGGTLYMDDISLLHKEDQSRLIEMLDQGRRALVTRDDGSAAVPADLRLVAGATTGAEELAAQGRLLEPLARRLRVLPIRLPPLRQRIADIPALASAWIDRSAARSGRTIVGMAPRTVAVLQRYSWPGNIRELEEHIARAVRRTRGPVIEEEDIAELAHMSAGRPVSPLSGTLEVLISLDETLTLPEIGRRAAVAGEVVAIRRALRLTGGNVTHAARMLGVSRLHLQKRMKRFGLREPV